MYRVMLCGAADTRAVADDFRQVVTRCGGDPWHYQDGNILYLNNVSADFRKHSAETVRASDIIVFVIVNAYGTVAWDVELRQALDDGKPFVILCLSDTYRAYLKAGSMGSEVNRLLTALEVERSLTIVPFAPETFSAILTRQLASMFKAGLAALELRNRREALTLVLRDPEHLTPHDLELTRQVAIDELEDKRLRKAAILALASTGGTDVETISELVRSDEQGVARLALDRLHLLHTASPPDPDLLRELVEICNDGDDVGLPRRLVVNAFAIDPRAAIMHLARLTLSDIGVRRRIAAAIDEHRDLIFQDGELTLAAIQLLRACIAKSTDSSWLSRARALLAEFGMDDEDDKGTQP